MRVFSSKAARWRALFGVAFLVVTFAAVTVAVQRYASFLLDAEWMRAWIRQFGVFAPLALILIQALQVIVAPIPGQIIALAAGYVFGPVAGLVYSLTGVVIGSAIAFSLAKRFGRPVVEQLVHEEVIARFDGFVDHVGIAGLLGVVIVPGLPDDAICFVSGLTKWRLRTFLAVIAVGRLPAYVLTVYAGGKLAAGQIRLALVVLGFVVFVSVVGYYKQGSIRSVIEQLGR
jgi:uncharacterized membrane protein YdjX (TVP38/TMEM64 family)